MAIHAKRTTIMPRDMQLLRDMWRRINPDCAIGAPNQDTEHQAKVSLQQTKKLILKNKTRLEAKVIDYRSKGTLHLLTKGEQAFCKSNHIAIT